MDNGHTGEKFWSEIATALHSCTVIHVAIAIKEMYLQAGEALRVQLLLFCLHYKIQNMNKNKYIYIYPRCNDQKQSNE